MRPLVLLLAALLSGCLAHPPMDAQDLVPQRSADEQDADAAGAPPVPSEADAATDPATDAVDALPPAPTPPEEGGPPSNETATDADGPQEAPEDTRGTPGPLPWPDTHAFDHFPRPDGEPRRPWSPHPCDASGADRSSALPPAPFLRGDEDEVAARLAELAGAPAPVRTASAQPYVSTWEAGPLSMVHSHQAGAWALWKPAPWLASAPEVEAFFASVVPDLPFVVEPNGHGGFEVEFPFRGFWLGSFASFVGPRDVDGPRVDVWIAPLLDLEGFQPAADAAHAASATGFLRCLLDGHGRSEADGYSIATVVPMAHTTWHGQVTREVWIDVATPPAEGPDGPAAEPGPRGAGCPGRDRYRVGVDAVTAAVVDWLVFPC